MPRDDELLCELDQAVLADAGLKGWREARLDLMLAEELQADPQFARWIAEPAFKSREFSLPDGDPEIRLSFNVWDTGGDGCPARYAGENDLDVKLTWQDGVRRVLIEDKVSAQFQPEQARRYRGRAASRGNTAAVLVAPQKYIDAHPRERALFHGTVSIEAIVDRLEKAATGSPGPLGRRLKVRAQLLRNLLRPTCPCPDPPTLDFCEYCCNWLSEHGPLLDPRPNSLRTANTTWLYFRQPEHLIYKASHGFVDLYVNKLGFAITFEQLKQLVATEGPSGFEAAMDTAREPNIVLRYNCCAVNPSEGAPTGEREANVIDALGACVRVTDWLARRSQRIGRPTG